MRVDRRALPGYLRELAALAPDRAAERIERDAAAGQLAPEIPAAVLSFLTGRWADQADPAILARIQRALGAADYGSGADYHRRAVATPGPAAKPSSAAAQTRAIETARIKRVVQREAEEERRREAPDEAPDTRPVVLEELELLGLSLSPHAVSLWAQDDTHQPVFLGFAPGASVRAWVQRKGGPQVALTGAEVFELLGVLDAKDAADALGISPGVLGEALDLIRICR